MAKTDNLNDFMTDLADSIREATGETESINAQSFSTRITGLGTGKQDKLVSGENIKTINGESVLGSGNISISSGSGTITGVSVNGTSVATSGVANIPAATTSKYGVTKLNSSTSSTSTTEAATPSAVKSAYDLANSYKGTVTGVKINGTTKNPSSGVVDLGTVITSHQDISGKQDKLVSGTNIKTINGTSILGSGDITISSGEGDYLPSEGGTITGNLTVMGEIASPTRIFATGGVQGYLRSGDYILGIKYGGDIVWGIEPLDEHYITASGDGTKFLSNDGTYKTISGGSSSGGSGAYAEVNHGTSDTTFTLTPNTFHVWDEVSELTLTLGSEQSGVANEFVFQFTSGSTPTSLTLPIDIKWDNDTAPTIAENMIYQISILKGLACVAMFSSRNLIEFSITTYGTKMYYAREDMTWLEWCNSAYNVDGYKIINGRLETNQSDYYLDVSPTTIINGTNYIGIRSGSGGAAN